MNSKLFWNIVRKIRKPNAEDLLPIMTEKGTKLYEEEEIKSYTAHYYEDLYAKRQSEEYAAEEWTEYIQSQVKSHLVNKEDDSTEVNEPFNIDELKVAVKSLKNNKSPGPDQIVNELITNGGEAIIQSIFELFEQVYETEDIPDQWGEAIITNFGKGKKVDPEKLSNKRGISLSSNIGKLLERIILKRALKVIQFTEAQAGSREGRGCVDQLFIFKSITQQRTFEGKQTFVAFLDLEKAYDKVWRDGLFYNLWKKGVRGKMWRLMLKLNSNLTAKIKTKYGYTRIISIKESIRQGGVLSGVEFACLIDQEEEELQEFGIGVNYDDILIASLLLMDDIIIVAECGADLQEMLDATHRFTSRYHLEFGIDKCKIMVMSTEADQFHDASWTLGHMILPTCVKHKWLGTIITPDNSIGEQIKYKKQLVESILQTCLAAASDAVLHRIKTQSLLKLHKQCIVPALLYGSETWSISAADYESLEQIQLNPRVGLRL